MTTLQQVASYRWKVPARPFAVRTEDGVRIEGTQLGPAGANRPALVMTHGLMGWHRKPRFGRFAERMSRAFTVYAFDLRGHGRSGGVCDFGRAEIWDVDAVLRHARDAGHARVVTMGNSMGGIAVLRHAGLLGGEDVVVAISSLAYWDWHGGANPVALRNLRAMIASAPGRIALRPWGVRLPRAWPGDVEMPEAPEDVVGKVAPSAVVIVHGANDHLFSEDHAYRLFEAANEPKRLLMGDRFGHAEDGLTPAFSSRLLGVIEGQLGAA
jgi:alpha-beta hydrolase superfamily lysophospholipase